MTHCHECDSEVAETDVFCPFCGISLEPVAVDDGGENVEFQSTIVMPKPVPQKRAEVVDKIQVEPDIKAEIPSVITSEHKAAKNISAETAAARSSFAEADTQEQIEGVVLPPTGEGKPTEEHPSAEDVPMPKVLQEYESSGTLPPSEAEAPAVPVLSQENEGKSVDSELTQEAARESSAVSVEPAHPQLTDEPKSDIVEIPATTAATPPDEQAFQPTEGEIERPAEILDSPDSFSTPSMFDSVRIIENKPPELKSDEPQPAVIKPVTTGEPSTPVKGNEPRQHTAPNIGIVDTDGRKSAKLKPLDEGTILNGRYEIVRKIGGGGMGAVYLASDNNLGGVLRAVKEMVQSYIEEEQQDKAINDFKRESMILSTLDHPSIPTIFDYFYDETESRFYLVMKYISGGDLSARLRSAPEGRIDEKTVTEWGIQVADVLDYLHSQPTTIVYRDLKPSNIMIDGNTGRVMLIDFGIARSIGQIEEKGVTAVGTMGYAPPELFSGNVEPRSDIYSLGSTMFHLLTGADPQSNPLLIFDFQKNPRPRQINPQLSDQIERILMRSVEYSAQARFSSSAEMKTALEEHLTNLKSGRVTYGVKEAPSSVSLANQNVFCGFCGQKIVATDLFCAFCGSKQPMAQHGVHAEIYTPARMTARLLVTGTSDFESSTFDLEKLDNLIGRRDPMSNIFPEVDLSRYDPQTKISRRHARIWREGNDFLVEDLGSSNGTTLVAASSKSMRLLPHQPTPLANGDQLRVGDTNLHFVIG